MNGIKVLVDTNVFIKLFEGEPNIAEHLQGKHIFVSVITEIELLGYFEITDSDNFFLKWFLRIVLL